MILAPHLVSVKGKDVGLPHKSKASERQLADGLYYEKDDDLYNGGSAFKVALAHARTSSQTHTTNLESHKLHASTLNATKNRFSHSRFVLTAICGKIALDLLITLRVVGITRRL